MANQWANMPGLEEKDPVQKWTEWLKAHQQWVAVSSFVVILVAVGIPYYIAGKQKDEAAAQLDLAQGQFYLQQRIDPEKGPFKSSVERDQHALQAFQEILNKYPGTSVAKLAKFYVARCQFNVGQYQQAYSSFESASESLQDTPLGDEAFYGKILCLGAQNQLPQAATLSETFLKEKGNSFIAPQVRLNLSDIYLKTQAKDKALEQLKWVAEKASDSLWGKEAQRRLKGLKS